VAVDPVGKLDMSLEPFLHHLGMRSEKFATDNQLRGYELPVRPESPLIQENPAAGLVDQARSPGFRRPSGIEILFYKQRQLVGIRDGHNFDVTAFVASLQPIGPQPCP